MLQQTALAQSCAGRLLPDSKIHVQGVKNAVPKTILQLMNVEGMTRENVASHLQKYRQYLKRMAGYPANVKVSHDDLQKIQQVATNVPRISFPSRELDTQASLAGKPIAQHLQADHFIKAFAKGRCCSGGSQYQRRGDLREAV